MKFLFDCDDNLLALPAAYGMIDRLTGYLKKIRDIDVGGEPPETRTEAFKAVLENAMVKYPKDTSEILARLWLLDEGEQTPNAFVTLAALLNSKTAIDFFTSVVPSIVSISNAILPQSK